MEAAVTKSGEIELAWPRSLVAIEPMIGSLSRSHADRS